MGGTGSYVYYLAKNLARLGNFVYVVTKSCQDGWGCEPSIEGVKVFHVETLKTPFLGSALFYKQSSRKLMEIVRKFSVNVVHTNLPLVPSFAVPNDLKEALVVTVHTTWKGENEALKREPLPQLNINERFVRIFNSGLRFFEGKLLERAERVIAVSNYTRKELLENYNVDARKVRVIPNGVDVNRFNPPDKKEKERVKREMGFDDNKIVLYVGRLCNRKGLPTLLGAASIVLRKNRNVKFVISGGGFPHEEKRLKALSRKLEIDEAALFLGYVPDRMLPKLYQAADVFVLPSIYEGMPFTLLEASASGLPVVATKVGGIPEVIKDGENGFLVNPTDPQGLAEKVLYLLENPSLAYKMGVLGRKNIEERFNQRRVTEQVLEVYAEICKE